MPGPDRIPHQGEFVGSGEAACHAPGRIMVRVAILLERRDDQRIGSDHRFHAGKQLVLEISHFAIGDREPQSIDVMRAELSQRRLQFDAALHPERGCARICRLAICYAHHPYDAPSSGQGVNQATRPEHLVVRMRAHHQGRHAIRIPRRLTFQKILPGSFRSAGRSGIELCGGYGCH